MEIQNARYTNAEGAIAVEIDGETHFIAPGATNRAAALVQDFVNQGGTIAPYEPDPMATVEQFREAINAMLEATARSRNYDSGVSLAGYATPYEPNDKWRQEGQAFVIWRSLVWQYAYEQFDAVMLGQREVPTVDEFLSELPAIDWGDEAGDE